MAVLLGLAALSSAGPAFAAGVGLDAALTVEQSNHERGDHLRESASLTETGMRVKAEGEAGNSDRSRLFSAAPDPAAPGKVTNVSLTIGHRKLDVTWSAPGGTITGYDVEWKKSSATQWRDAGHTGTTASHTITGLYEVTTYEVRVRAKDSDGAGEWSDIATASLLGQVKNVSLTAGEGQIEAAWDVPLGTLTGYDVEYKESSASSWTDAGHTGTDASHTIGSLTNGTAYDVRVRATNDNGSGPYWSSIKTSTPGTLPGRVANPRLVAGDGAIDATWEAPTGTAITGYDVQYSVRSANSWVDAGHTGTATSHTIGSLTNGTAYDVRVRAKNNGGNGDWSEIGTNTPEPPGKVADLTLSPQNRAIRASWSAPSGTVTGYHLEHKESSTANWDRHPTSSTSVDIVNKTNGTEYSVRVRAVNGNALGAWSDTGTVTPNKRPDQVKSLKLTAGDQPISASWNAPASELPITGYDVQYKKDSQPDGAYVYAGHTGTTTSYTITGLTNGTAYRVRVRAVNSAGLKSLYWSYAQGAVPGNNPPQFSGPDTANFAENGTGTVLTVTVSDSDPEDEITSMWLSSTHPDNPLFALDRHTGALTFKNVPSHEAPQDSGTDNVYEVVVSASSGSDYDLRKLDTNRTYKVTVTDVAEAPGKPDKPTVTAGNGELAVSWTAPDNTGPAISGYKLRHSTDGANWTDVTPSPATSTSHTLTGLTHGTTYQVQVRATNDEGDGAWSDSGDGRPITPGDAAILLNPVSVAVDEKGGTATYTVKLETAPTADVTVTVGSGDTDAATVAPASLTFTSTNWGTGQTVTVTGVADNAANPGGKRETTISHSATSTDTDYNISATLNVDVLDANAAPVFSGETTADFPEHGTGTALTVVATDPDSQDTVSYAIKSGKEGKYLNIDAATGALAFKRPPNFEDDQGYLTGNEYIFDVEATGGTGSRARTTTQEVTITVTDVREPPEKSTPPEVDPTDKSGELFVKWWPNNPFGPNITSYQLRYSTDGSNWTKVKPNWNAKEDKRVHTFTGLTDGTEYQVQVRAFNNEGDGPWSDSGKGTPVSPGPGVVLNPTSVAVNEDGGTATYKVKLATVPTASVTVTATVTWGPADAVTIAPTSLTFTTTSWGTEQEFTVTGVDDDVVNNGGMRELIIRNEADSEDWNYFRQSATLFVEVRDVNGAPTFSSDATANFAENGAGAALTVTATDPDGEDTVAYAIKSGKDGDQFDIDASTGALTFKTAPNYEDPKDSDTNNTYVVDVEATGGTGDRAMTATQEVTITVTDVDEAPGKPDKPTVATANGGELAVSWTAPANTGPAISGYTLRHSTDGSSWTEVTPSPATSTSHKLTGLTDGTAYQVQVRASSEEGDGEWSVSGTGTPVTPIDPAILLNLTSVEVNENGGTATYKVKLATAPTADVTVTLSSGDTTDATVSPASLTFTSTTWETAQTVTVTGVDDDVVNTGGKRETTITHSAESTDTDYDNLSVSLDVDILEVNGAPTFSGDTTADFAENGTGAALTVTATDPDGEDTATAIAYAIKSGKDGDQFDIHASTGALTFKSAPNYEDPKDGDTNNTYVVDVEATGGTGSRAKTATQEVTITVTDVTEAPGKPAAPTVATAGSGELAVSWTAPTNTGPAISGYKLRHSTDGSTWTEVTPSPATSTSHTLTGLTDGTAYQVQVRASSAEGDGAWSDTGTGTPVTPIDPAILLTPASVEVNENGGTATYTVKLATVPTASVTVTLSSGDTDAATVSPASLTFTSTTWETAQTVTVTGVDDDVVNTGGKRETTITHSAESTDTDYDNLSVSLDVDILEVNGAPTFSGDTTADFAENGAGAALTVTATDPDGEDAVAYAIKSGKDGDQFDIHASTGALTFKSAPNYEDPKDGDTNNTYVVDVEATGGTGSRAKTATQEVTITVTDVTEAPGKPAAPTVATAGSGELAVSWTAPTNTGPAISGYKLRHSTDGSTWTEVTPSPATSTSHTLTGLTDGTAYQVQVRASSAEGDGAWSDTGTGTPVTPIDPAILLTPASVEVNENGGTATYTVKLATVPTASVTVTLSSGDTDAATVSPASLTFTSTTWETAQTVTVTGVDDDVVNTGGKRETTITHSAESTDTDYDNLSVSLDVDILEVNGAPTFSGDTTADFAENGAGAALTVTATDPDGEDAVAYAIKSGKDGDQFDIHASTGALTFKSAPNYEDPKDGDTNNTYVVDVEATGGTGSRAKTATQEVTITVTDVTEAPGKPAAPTVATAGSGELAVSWTAPTNTGPPISGYKLRHSTDGATWTEVTPSPATSTSHTLTGLTDGTAYQVQVRAANDEGNGAWSDSGTGTPQPGAPGQVTNLALTAGDGQISASWDAPTGTITGYDVEYKESSASSWTDAGHTGTDASHTISSLTNGTEYNVRVRAKNDGGNGAWSDTKSATPVARPERPERPTNFVADPSANAIAFTFQQAGDAGDYDYIHRGLW